ncbi:unnamed protein product [marine sediment metagenome]|uniref:FCP1 homology domain-containing protein n=1 Tax=marine sediment metagenome TaxID=412755 RepID=X0Y6T4_9ZZZZ
MKKAFITLEGTLVHTDSYQYRPGASYLINALKDRNYQVFIMTDKGVEYARRWHEMLGLASVHGFVLKSSVGNADSDIVIDSDPSFMKRHTGRCIKPWNPNEEDAMDDVTLSRIADEIYGE